MRWCILTDSHFLYYTEDVPYAAYLGKPLGIIALEDIHSVRRVKVEVPEFRGKKNIKAGIGEQNSSMTGKNLFQFEIFMSSGEEAAAEFHLEDNQFGLEDSSVQFLRQPHSSVHLSADRSSRHRS
mmetsp:Transcript_14146/g.10202  ORF Transcript_14146/g.10202 Transcript_14146/m.10202 type:complete len:125 (+) Transcript_14146:1131-1505(+)